MGALATIGALVGAGGMTLEGLIRAIFAAGNTGAWYDPSDLSTLFQNTAGTTPVTAVGQPVGLMLDKSQGGKPTQELVTNGGFSEWSSDNPVGWAVVGTETAVSFVTQAGSAARIKSDGSLMGISQSGYVSGKRYKVRIEIDVINTKLGVLIGAGTNVLITSPGIHEFHIVATGTDLQIVRDFATGAVDATVSFISVREIPGNHATQSTSTARPTYQIDGTGKPYLLFDGVDDRLRLNTVPFQMADDHVMAAGALVAGSGSQAIFAIASTTSTTPLISRLHSDTGIVYAAWRDDANTLCQVNNTDNDTGLRRVFTTSKVANAKKLRKNGTQIGATNTTSVGATTVDSAAIGMQLTTTNIWPLSGNIYSLVVVKSTVTDGQLTAIEGYVNSKTGAY